jgi:peroxiredoxin
MSVTLREQTEALFAEHRRSMPPELMARVEGAVQQLIDSGIESRCLRTGDKIPPFALPDARGKVYDTVQLLRRGPLVLSFYRGGWCLYCNLELRALQECLPQIRAKGAELLAITPQRAQQTSHSAEENGLEYPILTDFENRVGNQFGLTYEVSELIRPILDQAGIDIPVENATPGYQLPVTATYVVDRSGTIVAAFTDPSHFRRMEPADIVAAIP